jgi:hemolysin III
VEDDALTAERPVWRGVFHSWAFFLSIPAGALLIVFASGAAGRTSAAIYTATLLAVFGTSASYHRLAQSYRARRIMQRLDHGMIYLLIAGTYAPICLVALPARWGIPLFASIGLIGLIGMVIKLGAIQRLQWLAYALYPIMG